MVISDLHVSSQRCCSMLSGIWIGAVSAPLALREGPSVAATDRPGEFNPEVITCCQTLLLVPAIRLERMTYRLQGDCSTN
jgi:hypothetical protein